FRTENADHPMAGVKGRSGRRRTSLVQLRLQGTLQPSRHLAKPLSMADWAADQEAYDRFLERLTTATTPRRWNPLGAYARRVVTGKVPAGTYHRLACARHLKDRQRTGKDFPYRLDLQKI